MPLRRIAAVLAAFLPLAVPAQQTVCTVTINSAEERDALQRFLPGDRFKFVELTQPGRADWFAAACEARVRCDVLVVSGHFAGTEFYSSRPDARETLKVSDLRGALCSASCPGVFENLKEVYLFGCDTLKAQPVRSAMPEVVRALRREGRSAAEADAVAQALSARYGESSRETLRRLFPDVPVIYGFASLAPYGRHAGPMLERWLANGGTAEFGTARPSGPLLSLFGPSSMVATSGVAANEPGATEFAAACPAYDSRRAEGERIEAMHALLAAPELELRMTFDRLEAFFDAPRDPIALAPIASDAAAASRYLGVMRLTQDPALRLRMIALARRVGWLDADTEKAEHVALVRDVVRSAAMDFGEVELVCSLNADGRLAGAAFATPAMTAPQAAALACLGDASARRRVLQAVAATDEHDVQAAQAYLRHHPLEDATELQAVVAAVVAMRKEGAQVRALETLSRHHIADPQSIAVLERLFSTTRSAAVQRAVAEVFLRAGRGAVQPARLAATVRAHRIAAAAGGDVIDQLLGMLAS